MPEDNPLSMAFELQRRTIEQSNEALKRSLDFQQQLNESLLGGLDSGTEAHKQSTELTRKSMHAALDTIESAVPGSVTGIEQVRQAVDEQFDAAEQAGDEMAELAEEGIENAEAAAQSYVDSIDQQLSVLLDAHEDIETQTEAFLDQTETQLEQLRDQSQAQLDEQIDDLLSKITSLRTEIDG